MNNSNNLLPSPSPKPILGALFKASYERVFQSPTLDYLHCTLNDIEKSAGNDLQIIHNQLRGLFLPLCEATYKAALEDDFLQQNYPQLIQLWKKVYLYLQEGPYASDAAPVATVHVPYEALKTSCQTIKTIVEELEMIHFEVNICKQSSLVYLLNTWLNFYSTSEFNAYAP